MNAPSKEITVNITLDLTIQRIIVSIIQWGIERNIVGGATAQKQFLKLMSEFGELGDAIAKNDIEGIKDGIGDSFVVIVLMAAILGHSESLIVEFTDPKESLPKERLYDEGNPEPIEFVYAIASDKMTYFGLTAQSESSYSMDAIFKCISWLSLIAARYELTMEVCALHAYNEIKDRTGVLFNGTFIKSTDARYEDAMTQIAARRAESNA